MIDTQIYCTCSPISEGWAKEKAEKIQEINHDIHS